MADNTTLNAPTEAGGDAARTLDRGTAKTQVVVLDVGGSGGENISPIVGTAGSPAAVVLSMQGVASGTALTIAGTVDLGATDNAVLDAIAASLAGELTVNLGGTDNAVLDAIAASLAGTLTVGLPAGASTLLEQQTQSTLLTTLIGHVDGLESSFADAVTALQIIDDWDESNRAKVNLVVGQAGVAAGAGAAGVTTLRMILATDDPAVGLLTTIDADTGAMLTALQLLDNAVSGAGFNISQLNGVAPSMGNGASGTGVQRVTLASDSTGVLAGLTSLTGSAVAHDGADSGNPHKIGAKASTSISAKTMVANDDRTDLFAGVDGVQITRPHCNLEDIVSGNASNTDGTSTSCIAAGGAGIKHYLTSVVLTNTSSSDIFVEIKDGATTKLTIPVPANAGAIFTPPVPIPGTANTAWNFDPSAAATTVYCSMVGFKSKV